MKSHQDREGQRIMMALQRNARITTAELAAEARMSASPCWRRVKSLERAGYITGYHAQLDRKRLGWDVAAFVFITVDAHREKDANELEATVRALPEVISCHAISGVPDLVLQVIARSLDDYAINLLPRLRRLPGVKEMRTAFVLKDVKPGQTIPIPSMG